MLSQVYKFGHNPYWGILHIKIRQRKKQCLQKTAVYSNMMKHFFNLLFFFIQIITTRTATRSSTTITTIMIIIVLLSLEFSPATVVVNPENAIKNESLQNSSQITEILNERSLKFYLFRIVKMIQIPLTWISTSNHNSDSTI